MSVNEIHEDERFQAIFGILAPEHDQDTAEQLAIEIMQALEDVEL